MKLSQIVSSQQVNLTLSSARVRNRLLRLRRRRSSWSWRPGKRARIVAASSAAGDRLARIFISVRRGTFAKAYPWSSWFNPAERPLGPILADQSICKGAGPTLPNCGI